jgi:hypothetical protein
LIIDNFWYFFQRSCQHKKNYFSLQMSAPDKVIPSIGVALHKVG